MYHQDELSVLEKGLLALDDDDNENRELALQSRQHDEETDDDPESSRKALMKKISDKLKEYGRLPTKKAFLQRPYPKTEKNPPRGRGSPDDLVRRIQTYVSLEAPSTRNVTSFTNWFGNHKPLVQSESDFMKHRSDFVALSGPRESGWLDGKVEDGLIWILPRKIMGVRFAFLCTGKKFPWTLFANEWGTSIFLTFLPLSFSR